MWHKNKIPRIMALIEVGVPVDAPLSDVLKTLGQYDSCKLVERAGLFSVVYRRTPYINAWSASEILTVLFQDSNISALEEISSHFGCEITVCLSFHHYKRYPALEFDGQNMEILHALSANLSIDPY